MIIEWSEHLKTRVEFLANGDEKSVKQLSRPESMTSERIESCRIFHRKSFRILRV